MITIRNYSTTWSIVAMVAMVLVLIGSSLFAEETAEATDEPQAIMQLERDWSTKCTEGALDWIIDLHSENAVQLPPGGDLVQGKVALRAAWDGMVNTEGLVISWEPTEAFVSESGDMAYDYGKATIKNPDGSVVNAKYLVVWSKINGDWKVVADMFNMNGAGEK